MKIIGIRRDALFSPNMQDADTAIFEAAATRLEALGHEVLRTDDSHAIGLLTREKQAVSNQPGALFSMSRNTDILTFLCADTFYSHLRCVNPAIGVQLCSVRSSVNAALERCGVPMPETISWPTDLPLESLEPLEPLKPLKPFNLPFPFWIKRDKGYSQVREDVVLVHNPQEAETTLRQFRDRGEETVLCSEHVEGDLVKFYGVAGTDFFDWDYADPTHSKFGLEEANGVPRHYDFDVRSLQEGCNRLSEALSTPVYGGDAIVRPDGSFVIIDFNDWPSFSRCREAAADAIVKTITK